MDPIAWALYAFITAAAVAAVVLHYRLREPAGRGRGLLVALRAATLGILILLLFDPVLPAAAGAAGRAGTVVLLDASLSMRMAEQDGGTRWEAARQVTAAIDADGVLRFGDDDVEAGPGESEPDAVSTRLGPAVRAAAETGARRVVVVTDGGVEDAAEALGLAARAGLAVDVRTVGESVEPNAGIVEVEAPGWMEVGEESGVSVSVAAMGAVEDSLTVVLRQGARELARARVEAPTAGRLAATTLRFTPRAPAAGPVRLEAALEETDGVSDDDGRSVYVRIDDDPAGVALVSFRPDQEPRFLLPVLERALGVPVRGWMVLPEGRFVQLGSGAEAGMRASENSARRAVQAADLVVLHGLGPGSPSWARDAAGQASRVLVLPAGATVEGLPFAPGPEGAGDWYPAAEIPSSPVAPLMAGLEPGDAPPLRALRTPEPPPGWWAPMEARLGRRGPARPVLLAGTRDGRRIAVALGDGYWRWAFAGGAARETYDRFWSAVAGWLVEESRAGVGDGVAPVDRVVARGEPVRFRVPPATDSVRLRLSPPAGGRSARDAVVPVRNAEAVAGVFPPGHYRYEARAYGADGGTSAAAGELTVESFSREFTRPAVSLEGAQDGSEGARRAGSGRPLRASAWPYALVVLLLCVEWVLRRRWGLR
ncbi:MAG: hypothetical protein KY466_08220 [Gemmatimonadetes bacterium]|nr:hypothetical protein [Gemmatimonadota bacterium]